MNKKVKYLLIGVGVVLLISIFSSIGSCGSSSEEYNDWYMEEESSTPKEHKDIVLTVAQTEVKGDLKGCYEVVEKNYRVKHPNSSSSEVISVELKRTNKELPYDRDDVVIYPEAEESSANYCAGFGIEILDEYGDVIEKQSPSSTPYSWDEMTAMLHLTTDDTATLEFRFYDDIPEEATSLRITSIVQRNEKKKSVASTRDDDDDDDDESSLGDVLNKSIEMAEKSIYEDTDFKQLKKDAETVLDLADKTLDLMDKLDW